MRIRAGIAHSLAAAAFSCYAREHLPPLASSRNAHNSSREHLPPLAASPTAFSCSSGISLSVAMLPSTPKLLLFVAFVVLFAPRVEPCIPIYHLLAEEQANKDAANKDAYCCKVDNPPLRNAAKAEKLAKCATWECPTNK
jgi:hypothetical protein